jgi:transposase
MSGKAAKIRLTEKQHTILQQIVRSTTAPQRLVQRARLIVLAFDGMFNRVIANAIGLQRKQVGLWRRRWKQSFDALVAIECRESQAALRRAIEEVLGDAPRSGSSGKFTAEQVTQVLAFEYTRHGTLCLIGNWHVVLGQMIAPTIRPTRTEEDFCWHIHHTVATDLDAGWVFVVDNLNTHCSESLVRYVARLEGIEESTLGKKDKVGILKSMPTRQAFLSDRSHRIRFVYLPKHSSWLNQIEIVFGIVTRRVLRRGNFQSTEALKERLLDFIDYFNRTFAKPFRWTYTGRPLAAATVKRPATWKEKWANYRESGKTLALVA